MLVHLNRVLARQADCLGARVEIVAQNVFSVEDYDAAARKLDSGAYTFRQVQERIGG